MYSMTGYGKGEYSEGGVTLTAEVRSVNNRYLDVAVKSPRVFLAAEELIRSLVRGFVSRGHVDVFISYTDRREKAKTFTVDYALARAYRDAAAALGKEGIPNDLTASFLLRQPDVVRAEEEESDDELLLTALREALTRALEAHRAMRLAEGTRLEADILSHIEVIARQREEIAARAPAVATEYREKLTARMQEFLAGKVEETRILTEAAIYADKCAIDEELARLSSHIAEFRKISSSEQVGRKLDFLIQEFNRECNTICSKSNDKEITRTALGMKNEIEKVREQIQNLE